MIKFINYLPYFVILIMPFSLITGPAIPDISITLIGLSFLFYIFFNNKFKDIYKYNWVKISIFFWCFLLFISLFAENKYLSYKDSIIFIRCLVIPIFIFFWVLNTEVRVKNISFVVFLAIIFVIIDSIYQFTNYDPISGFGSDIFGYVPNFYGRLTGPFQDLVPGAYISKFSLIGLIYIFLSIKNKNFQKFSIITYLTLVGIVTFISGERMALATFLLAIILLIFFFDKRRLTFLISLFFIIISCFIIKNQHPIYNDYKILESTPYHLGLKVEKNYICNNSEQNICKKTINLQPSFFEVIKNFNQSAYGQIYSLSIKMWLDHPFQGIGLNNFTYLCNNDKRYIGQIKNYDCVTHPHNLYLQWLVEAGIFGLLFFILYLFFIIKFILKKNNNPFSILSLVTLVILFWPIMSTGSLLKNWMGVSTFFIIGISLSINRIKQKIL